MLDLQTNSTSRVVVDATGRLLVNTASTFGTASNSCFYSFLQVKNNTSGASDGRIALGTSATSGSDTALGQFIFCDSDGGDRAAIRGYSSSAGGASNFPGYLAFYTNSGAVNPTERLRITSAGVLQIAEAGDITVGTTTGTKIGTATTQKLGFYNKTPVVQPVAVADATTSVDVITQFNALLARMRDLGLIAT